MTSGDFNKAIQKLENFYGKEYNDVQKQEIFRNFSQYTPQRFNYLLSIVYKSCKYLPMLSELVEIHDTIPYNEIKKKLGTQTKCEKCKRRGFYIYYKKVNGIEYDFIVKCDCSDEYSFDGRKIKDVRNKSRYFVPTQAEAHQYGLIRRDI